MSLFRDPASRAVSGGSQQDVLPAASKAMPKAVAAAAVAEPDVHYTCFIRLPFPRADFVDPPQVEWSSVKDRALWKIISKASNSKDLDWEDLSNHFEVSLSFLLQQAAWLYERHFAQMKAQMKKLSPSANPSPIPPDSTSNISTPVTGTFPTSILGPRATSALSSRARDSPTPNAGSGNLGIIRPASGSSVLAGDAPSATYSSVIPPRTASARTVTSSRVGVTTSPNPNNNRFSRSSFGNQRKVTPQTAPLDTAVGYESPPPAELSESDSSSEEDERASQSMARSQAFRRPPHLSGGRKGGLLSYADEAEEDEDEEGGFLPFAASSGGKGEDLAGTLRSAPSKKPAERERVKPAPVELSASSGSSNAGPSRQQRGAKQVDPASALSPRRRAELGFSPLSRRDGSEGVPSMGSSFSDLDDASISQSALEDAYLSNIQRGSTASRMSTISQALKSRYL